MTTYTQLISDATLWTQREDTAALAPTCLLLAEKNINRKLRMLEQEEDITFTFTSPDYSDELPEDYIGLRAIIAPDYNNPEMLYVPPSQFLLLNHLPGDAFSSLLGSAGLIYTIVAGQIRIHAPVGATDPVTCQAIYHQRWPALNNTDSTTHFALQTHYDLYLWGVLKEVWDAVDDENMVMKYQARFQGVLDQIADEEKGKRRGASPLSRRPPESGVV